MNLITENEIRTVLSEYGIEASGIGEPIDTSRGEEDKRFTYVVNQEYVLKVCTSGFLTEEYLAGVDRLIHRYRSIGVYCPALIKNNNDAYLYLIKKERTDIACYVEEYAKYRTAEKVTDIYKLKRDMLWHVGKLANGYTGVDLVKTRSMWSIIELAPLDVGINEKQENLNMLVAALRESGERNIANQIETENERLRDEIGKHLECLPKCVYQGDLNESNVLIDEHDRFTGIIDFNMHGTEVNINCFLNETMYFLRETDFDRLSAEEILNKMNSVQNELMNCILNEYSLNEVERFCLDLYKKVIYLSFFPNVILWTELLQKNKHKDKVIRLLKLIIEM